MREALRGECQVWLLLDVFQVVVFFSLTRSKGPMSSFKMLSGLSRAMCPVHRAVCLGM